MRYLLAAEADKIQEFIFRSSRLREVVGASQMLSRFCEEGAPPLFEKHGGNPDTDIFVNDGGSFRIVFHGDDAENRARAFGADLAELYRLSVIGSFSVAEPVQWEDSFQKANEEAGRALRRVKSHRTGAVAEIHMPYVAFCASCGVGLAEAHGRLIKEPTNARERYLCATCQTKAQARDMRTGFLHNFLVEITGSEDNLGHFATPEDADDVAAYDLRKQNYVAYLVADGNGMGKTFGQCDEVQIKTLSEGLTGSVLSSLAEVTGKLIAKVERHSNKYGQEIVPVLPLILGGDDLFALIPSAYALDFARQFCLAYEEKIGELTKEIGGPKPTVAAAVVICKSKYPYALAHRRAHHLLEEAKRQCKQLAAKKDVHLSAVNFEVILGNRLAGQDEEDKERWRAVRPSLKPYWAADAPPVEAREYGISLSTLLEQRFALKDLPQKRLAEVRAAFAHLPDELTVQNRKDKLPVWEQRRLERLFKRSGFSKELCDAMRELGHTPAQGETDHHWVEVRRSGESPLAHGLPDLIETWDFAQDLEKRPKDYEAEEREA